MVVELPPTNAASMIPAIRTAFNAQFTPEKYQQYLSILNAPFKDLIPFRIAETPVFIDQDFKRQLLDAGDFICNFIIIEYILFIKIFFDIIFVRNQSIKFNILHKGLIFNKILTIF